jgi:hypothetical protein
VVFPYDDFVDEWRQKIEEHYGVEITVDDVKDIIKDMAKAPHGGTNTNKMYWALFDIKVTISLVKTPPPAGFESDNLMFEPVKTYGMSQNIMLIHLIEMKAREKVFEKYIDEILGTRAKEEEVWKQMEKELEGEEEKKKRIEVATEKFSAARERVRNFFYKILPYFVKLGQYEPLQKERVSKQYNRSLGPDFEKISDYIMDKMQVD